MVENVELANSSVLWTRDAVKHLTWNDGVLSILVWFNLTHKDCVCLLFVLFLWLELGFWLIWDLSLVYVILLYILCVCVCVSVCVFLQAISCWGLGLWAVRSRSPTSGWVKSWTTPTSLPRSAWTSPLRVQAPTGQFFLPVFILLLVLKGLSIAGWDFAHAAAALHAHEGGSPMQDLVFACISLVKYEDLNRCWGYVTVVCWIL